MAQIGFPVPCEYCRVSIRSSIYTRIGCEDDLQGNCSTFFKEMSEISFCLETISDDSLVLIDELGRGTSLTDGMAIAGAICEELISKRVFSFVVTHFVRLIAYLGTFPSVNVLQLKTEESTNGKLRCLYRAEEGVCSVNDYGIRLAESLGLPPTYIEAAREAKRKYAQFGGVDEDGARTINRMVMKRKLIFETALQLKEDHGPESLALIKDEFMKKLNEIAQL